MTDITCKLLVIGAGPGGYVCAIRAGQLGLDTVIVESGKLGGSCLNVGCIPSKAMIHVAEEFEKATEAAAGKTPFGLTSAEPKLDLKQAVAWKDGIVQRLNSGVGGLLRKAKVKIVQGRARFRDGKTVVVDTETGPKTIHAEAIVIATGSAPVELPFLRFGGNVISSTGALALTEVPKRLVVVGGGYIGLELGTAFAKLGAKVTVVEAQQRILPLYDAELTAPVAKRLTALGVEVLPGAKALGPTAKGDGLRIETAEGRERELPADRILVTVGRKPVTEDLGLENLVLDMEGRFVRIGERCETAMRGIYAIGDVTGEPMLAHRAMAQGEMVAEIVAGLARAWDKRAMPAVCFTDPEIVSVGLSPEQAKQAGHDLKLGQFPFQANGRAMTRHGEAGFVRVVADARNDLVLGIQAVGQGVSELSAAFGLAIEMGATLQDVAGTIHAHPTLGEAFPEAAMKALGHALHI
ncbi:MULTISPECIES: dihydrolipoyl dehydrogenase [unclassified Bosea (in: a-proteobacteria)]|uniref:dihydrolipoyl dehydrogenase n=1 Tax=unclassified Bosea (in: a-proteobacteria) TaxID=2653178 RepID=UPI0009555921|nr:MULTISPECIES: dihydrolipoyl dehydrogenase [unclassified Bosea (in: a-proteobacteria)]TAJ34513.1 MAG: dihydrolipoyl dehydrogenase [Bosea sp. (in: a-proteobacteria)]SIQ87905.1 dihydrolipoamide dehydrogenase [Bosea sp. TND4EK4]